ncbi:MAG: MerR family DNA-binding transcriptional regulator [Candidatus Thiodiazotropha sp.]
MTKKDQLFSVTDLSREFGITQRTVRFYEEKGLLFPRRVGSARVFDYRDKARLTLILRFKRLGFELTDIKAYLDLYDADSTGVTQLKMGHRTLTRRIKELKSQMKDLRLTLKELEALKRESANQLMELGINSTDL